MLRQQPSVYILTLTNADEEYSWTCPIAVKKINIQARESRDVRMAFQEGGTAAIGSYWTLKSGQVYYEDYPLEIKNAVFYFRDPTNAGTNIEILYWQEVGI